MGGLWLWRGLSFASLAIALLVQFPPPPPLGQFPILTWMGALGYGGLYELLLPAHLMAAIELSRRNADGGVAKVSFGFHLLAAGTQWFHATLVDEAFDAWLGPAAVPAPAGQEVDDGSFRWPVSMLHSGWLERDGQVTVERGIEFGGHGQTLDVWRMGSGSRSGSEASASVGVTPGAPAPILFYVHGGAWTMGSSSMNGATGMLAELARRGWVCVAINYRKAPSNVWPAMLDDASEALTWTREHAHELGADKASVVVAGDSAGGHIAACLVQQDLRRGALVKGLLLISPVLDVLDLPRGDADAIDLEGAGNLRFPLSLPSPLHYTAGQSFLSWFWSRWVAGIPAEDANNPQVVQLLAEASPIRQLREGFPPTLVLHGTADGHVPISHSRAFVRKLRELRGEGSGANGDSDSGGSGGADGAGASESGSDGPEWGGGREPTTDRLVEIGTAPHSFCLFMNAAPTEAAMAGTRRWLAHLLGDQAPGGK